MCPTGTPPKGIRDSRAIFAARRAAVLWPTGTPPKGIRDIPTLPTIPDVVSAQRALRRKAFETPPSPVLRTPPVSCPTGTPPKGIRDTLHQRVCHLIRASAQRALRRKAFETLMRVEINGERQGAQRALRRKAFEIGWSPSTTTTCCEHPSPPPQGPLPPQRGHRTPRLNAKGHQGPSNNCCRFLIST